MNTRRPGHSGRAVVALALAAQLASPLGVCSAAPVKPARPSSSARALSPAVRNAQSNYDQGLYDEAVTLLLGPVSRGELKGAELTEARILLARCYVKKGLIPRAKEHFSALIAADPAFVLEKPRVDDEELAVFRSLKPSAPAPPPAPLATTTPIGPAPAPTPAAPRTKTPAMRAALPDSNRVTKRGWLSSHKSVAALVAIGGGTAAVLIAGSGGDKTTPGPVTPTVPDFPPPPPTP